MMNRIPASAPAPWSGKDVTAPGGAAVAVRRPLRVLLVAPNLDPSSGGIGGVSHTIRRLLEAKACRGELVCRSLDLHGQREAANSPQDWTFGGSRWKFSYTLLWAMANWADLVIFTHVGPASLLLLLPRFLRPRCVVFLHGIEVWTRLGYRKRAVLEQADLLISNSQFTADRARAFNPSLGSVHRCHLGISDQDNIPDLNEPDSMPARTTF